MKRARHERSRPRKYKNYGTRTRKRLRTGEAVLLQNKGEKGADMKYARANESTNASGVYNTYGAHVKVLKPMRPLTTRAPVGIKVPKPGMFPKPLHSHH